MTDHTIRAFGVDPSLSCTGYAVVEHSGLALDTGWRLITGGTISAEPDGRGLWDRISRACADLLPQVQRALIGPGHPISIVAVEMPMDRMFVGARRSATTLPGYGAMCGAVAMMVERAVARVDSSRRPELLTPSATQWAIGMPKAGTRREKGKPGRVFAAESLFGEIRVARGGVAAKEAIADAALLARWAIMQEQRTRRGV